ncbi:MAG: hypothetical protein WBW99_04180 [Pseudolabrys sp.]
MSTPIQQGELSPDDPKFYAPPKWRSVEIDAPSIQPSLRAAELPVSQPSADWTSRDDNVLLVEVVSQSREHPDNFEHSRMRVTVLAIAVGVVVWTAFCIAVGLGRLETTAFAQMRNGLLFANDPEISVSERLQAANTVVQKVSWQVLAPTLAVADASGDVNAALPLAIKVTNYTPDISINLSGLVVGTMLSSGSDAGEGQWRIAIDDLPNTHVIPPPGYVGSMTVIAELRSGDDQAIVRTPVQLIWHPGATGSTEATEPQSSAVPPPDDTITTEQAVDEQLVAPQKESTVTQPSPRVKPRRHHSDTTRASSFKNHSFATKRRHRVPLSDPEQQTSVDPGWEQRLTLGYDLFANADRPGERRPLWNNNLQTIIDGSWERCERWANCSREMRR